MKTVEEKYGVPTFETCKKLAKYWKEKTLFSCIESQEYFDGYGIVLTSKIPTMPLDDAFVAPQIHELLEMLPTTILYENYFYDLEIRKGCVFYSGFNRDIFEFESDNLAECLAQIYTTLKEKELL